MERHSLWLQWKQHYDSNGIYPFVNSPNGKSMIIRKIVFGSGNCHGKRLKKNIP